MRVGRSRAFTIVELLIALVVVGLGFVGLLALLSASLRSSGAIVEDSFAATLARSVYESLREGARRRPFIVKDGDNFIRGFVFLHDGVKDPGEPNPPSTPYSFDGPDAAAGLELLRSSDFAIFLPQAPATGLEPIFVFPRPGGAEADNKGLGRDNSLPRPQAGYAGQPIVLDVKRTYELKNRATGARYPEVADQYSFALALRRSKEPAVLDPQGKALAWTGADGAIDSAVFPPRGAQTVDGLYEVEILVYRSFDPLVSSRSHEPVRGGRLVGLIAMGP